MRLECWQEGGELVGHVVKRFHGANWTRRLFDGRRARREQDALKRMRAAGLPVPTPLALKRKGGRWELTTELVRDGLPLRLALEGFAPWPLPAKRLCAPLGALLAKVYAVGLDHADLHSGNVLIDPAGKPWLIDLGKSRLEFTPTAEHIEAELARLAGEARERLDWRFRMRFLRAFLAALPPNLRSLLPTDADWPLRLEARARQERRRILHRARLRWTRASSAVRPFRLGSLGAEHSGFVRRGISDEQVEQVLQALAGADLRFRMTSPLDADQQLIGLRAAHAGLRSTGLAWRDLRELWYTSARLDMHHLPCARPLLIVRSPRPAAVFELKASALPLDERLAAEQPGENESAARRRCASLGKLIGALHDRGLSMRSLTPEHIWIDGQGGTSFGIGTALESLVVAQRAQCWQTIKAASAPLSRGQRAAFLRAYLREQGAGPQEGRELRRELRGE